ncbi:hypothetical protein N7457_000777 [Penicillium paradoxum]|uniref:uncharacterized protein n=1 Tax=Penicillium paradoxum TaxID=176176 RepID=UPI00254726EE|nr:uncharacterized protein N7457_000777 [Penicillium paradoxum]KAJ5794178.1 hypothetical protein N7457_000777 [Penicillium paradoxum]
MSQSSKNASWLPFLVVALLAVSTVHAHPIHQIEKEDRGQAGKLESRSPRLIPDTENYVNQILQGLGLAEPIPTATPTPSVKAEQNQPKSLKASPSPSPLPITHIIYSSSTSYTPTYGSNGASYTQTVKHETSNKKPMENIELVQGWNKDRKLTAEDLPLVFEALRRELKHRLSDMINSSDEIGLENFLD